LVLLSRISDGNPTRVQLEIPDDSMWGWLSELATADEDSASWKKAQSILDSVDLGTCVAGIFPEGRGPWAFDTSAGDGLHVRRSYLLAGWSLEGRQVAGIERALRFVQRSYPKSNVRLTGKDGAAELALHATLLSPDAVGHLALEGLRTSYREGFVMMGALRHFDMPEVLAAVASEVPVSYQPPDAEDSEVFRSIERLLGKPLLQPSSTE
jgi:hypothetical protein